MTQADNNKVEAPSYSETLDTESLKADSEKVFYGWWIVVGSFGVLTIAVGAGLYSLPVFLVHLQEHFGWTRAGISAGPAIGAVVSGGLAPFIGLLLEKFGTRKVMCVGALIMALGFVGLASMEALWHFWFSSAVVAIGISCVAFVPVQTLISHWFTRRRGLAMGLTLSGIGLGGLILVPSTGLMIENYGWRSAYLTLGGLILVVVTAIVVSVIRQSPHDMGLLPDGDSADETSATTGSDGNIILPGLDLGAAMRSRAFWLITAANFLVIFTALGVVQHLHALLTDAGYQGKFAASILGITIGITIVGRISFGILTDRLAIRWVYAAVVALPTIATFLLLQVEQTWALVAFCICFGLGLGGAAVMVPLAVGACFGLKAYSKIVGAIFVSATAGAALGPVVTGQLYDLNGNYNTALIVLGISGCMGILAAAFVTRPKSIEALEVV